MKILLLSVLAVFIMAACGSQGTDFSKPESVVEAIFKAAKTKDFESLKALCDPKGENDGDTKDICGVADNKEMQEEFVQFFEKGKVSGSARIEGDEAEVDFTFGPSGNDTETMNLIQRDGKWYLKSF
jgi:hypothetical protein